MTYWLQVVLLPIIKKSREKRKVKLMVIEVKEVNYRGFLIRHVKNKGWKIVMKNDVQFIFPTYQDAQCAVDDFHSVAVPKNKGRKIKESEMFTFTTGIE